MKYQLTKNPEEDINDLKFAMASFFANGLEDEFKIKQVDGGWAIFTNGKYIQEWAKIHYPGKKYYEE